MEKCIMMKRRLFIEQDSNGIVTVTDLKKRSRRDSGRIFRAVMPALSYDELSEMLKKAAAAVARLGSST